MTAGGATEETSPVVEDTDGGLKLLLSQMTKWSCLEVPGCCLSTEYEICGPLGCCCPFGSVHLGLLSYLYDLACWHLGFWNCQDVFPGRAAGCSF